MLIVFVDLILSYIVESRAGHWRDEIIRLHFQATRSSPLDEKPWGPQKNRDRLGRQQRLGSALSRLLLLLHYTDLNLTTVCKF